MSWQSQSEQIDMCRLLESTLVGDRTLDRTPPAIVFRLENVFIEEGEFFFVDAKCSWNDGVCNFEATGPEGCAVSYKVAACVVHRHGRRPLPGELWMHAGDYDAFCHQGTTWHKWSGEDSLHGWVEELSAPPTCFPCIVFLVRSDWADAGRDDLAMLLNKRMCDVRDHPDQLFKDSQDEDLLPWTENAYGRSA